MDTSRPEDGKGPAPYGAGGSEAGSSADQESPDRVTTVPQVRNWKVRDGRRPLTMVTAYDTPGARWAEGAGVDLVLVGDSVAMVVLGRPDTLTVSVEDMAHHVGAVARAGGDALVVGDMPWGSYHTGERDAVLAAMALVRAGAQAVKLEGGAQRAAVVRAVVGAEIPVMGHLGLTPQSLHAMGGYRVQGRDAEAARQLVEDARALEAAGCFALVLEGVPGVVAATVTDAVGIPTIGIGAGVNCDGQVLVLHDVLGMQPGGAKVPKFVRQYTQLGDAAVEALEEWVADVHEGRFPSPAETYRMPAPPKEADGERRGRSWPQDLEELAFVDRSGDER